MKKVTKLFLVAAIAGMAACGGADKQSERSVKDLRVYVDSIERDHANYYDDDTYWTNVESTYEEKRQQVDAKASQLDEKTKKEYEELKNEYAALKEKYTSERTKVKEYKTRKIMLRNALFGEGVIGEDINFAFMTGANAAKVYDTFANRVSENKDNYSREDWDEVKVLYEAMDTRKNEIEKEISSKDSRSIAASKIRFSAIKAVNRPFSKMEENSDAKDRADDKK